MTKGSGQDASVKSSIGSHVANPASRRRVEPLFAEPSAYFRSDFPGLDERRQSLNERGHAGPTHADGPQRPRASSAQGPSLRTWESKPLRSWPTRHEPVLVVEEPLKTSSLHLSMPVPRSSDYSSFADSPENASDSGYSRERPHTASIAPTYSRKDYGVAKSCRPVTALTWQQRRRLRSPYNAAYTRDHWLASSVVLSLPSLRKDLGVLIEKIQALEDKDKDVAFASQTTPAMGQAPSHELRGSLSYQTLPSPGADRDQLSRSCGGGDGGAGGGGGVGGGPGHGPEILSLHKEVLDTLVLKFGLSPGGRHTFRPQVCH
jgi:hypothetical protein